MSQAAIVHIIDDDESQRETLVSLLGSVDLQGRAYPSVAAFLAAKLPDAPGCLILDVRQRHHSDKTIAAELPLIATSSDGVMAMRLRPAALRSYVKTAQDCRQSNPP